VQECFDKRSIPTPRAEDYPLTKREKEILKKVLQGGVYKQIAGECFISRHTLNSHLKKIYRKLRVHSRAEAAAKFSGYPWQSM
jgi:DNA-binding CsgD family transcriptional regulator